WRGIVWNTAAPWVPGRAASRVARLFGHRGLDPSRFSALRPGLVERMYAKAAATANASQPLAQQSLDVWDRPFRDGQLERLAMLAGDYGAIDKGVLAWWGIDTRGPTADRRLVEFSLCIPTEAFIHEGTPKALIRKV